MSASILFDAPGPKARARHLVLTIIGALLAAASIGLVLWKFQKQGQLTGELWKQVVNPDVWTEYVLPGIVNTIKAAALSIVFAMIFGILFGMGRLSHNRAIRWVSGIIVEFFRAVPVLLMMLFIFLYFGNRGTFGESNALVAVVIALTLYNGSVIAELVRSGVHQLPKGQREAGLSIGLTAPQTLRMIQLPQALTSMLPALVGQLVVALKDTALGTALPYDELLQRMKDAGTAYGAIIPLYVLAALLFILINYSLTVLAGRIERRLNQRGKTPKAGPGAPKAVTTGAAVAVDPGGGGTP